MTHIINWINYHECEHNECDDWKKQALHQLIRVVERTKERGNPFQFIPHSHCLAKHNIVCMQIFQFGNAWCNSKLFPSLGGFTVVILICNSLDVGTLPPTLGTKVLSVCTWLTKLTFWRIEMAAVCTDWVASRGSYINSLNRSIAIIRNQRIIVGQICYKC